VHNLRLLEEVGIHSIAVLASEDPDKLYDKLKRQIPGRPAPKKAKLKIWIREAQKKVHPSEF